MGERVRMRALVLHSFDEGAESLRVDWPSLL
jgi:hypothetical protein